ncbi:hypothetical protein F1880_006592 [Penicillium rolfsii]|nr:hypothetical protein F1880_006592 [Penicillium rolfsii]
MTREPKAERKSTQEKTKKSSHKSQDSEKMREKFEIINTLPACSFQPNAPEPQNPLYKCVSTSINQRIYLPQRRIAIWTT